MICNLSSQLWEKKKRKIKYNAHLHEHTPQLSKKLSGFLKENAVIKQFSKSKIS